MRIQKLMNIVLLNFSLKKKSKIAKEAYKTLYLFSIEHNYPVPSD